MRLAILLSILACAQAGKSWAQAQANPIEKVIEMISELEQKVIGEGEAAQKLYDEFAEWCEEESKNLQFEIKTGKAEAEDLQSTIDKCVSDIKALDDKIEGLVDQIAQDEEDLKEATGIREKENADFLAVEADLVDTIDALERAIGILEREMAKTGAAALVQVQNAQSLVESLSAMVEASTISVADGKRLTALVQSQESSQDSDEELGAPDPAVYKSKSGGIVDVLNDLLEKAEGELEDARKAEMNAQHNYDMLKQELDDSIKFGTRDMDKAKKSKAATAETQATAEGDLEVTNKALGEDIAQLNQVHHDCMTKATDFEVETKSRAEELKALATAKKIIVEATGGAAAQTYDLAQTDTSFLQTGARTRLAVQDEAVKFIKNLSQKLGSPALAQLANRMAAAARMGVSAGGDPFAKVKGLITEMIDQLLKEAEADAAHKGYCDKEMSETKAKKEELTTEIEELTTKIDKMSADSATLKEEASVLSKELADLAKSQQEMDKIRAEENSAYKTNKAEMEEGLEGIKLALKVLREYYAGGGGAQGAGDGIISMLEVIESDFSKGLAEMIAVEEAAVEEYEKITKENEISKVTKEQDVKYKGKEAKGLDEAVAEASSDKAALATELESVEEYWLSITEQCVEKVEPYEERKKRREAEIQGLKDALAILNGEAVFLQEDASRKLRGVG